MKKIKSLKTWQNAFWDHILLTAYWRLSPQVFREILQRYSLKHQTFAFLYSILGVLFITLGFQGILDGPEIIAYYLEGNPYPWSITLLKPGYITYFFLFSIVFGTVFIVPVLLIAFLNRICPKSHHLTVQDSFYFSNYAILSGAIFSPIVLPISLIFLGSNPQMLFLEDRLVWNLILAGFSLINGIALFAFGYFIRNLYLDNR